MQWRDGPRYGLQGASRSRVLRRVNRHTPPCGYAGPDGGGRGGIGWDQPRRINSMSERVIISPTGAPVFADFKQYDATMQLIGQSTWPDESTFRKRESGYELPQQLPPYIIEGTQRVAAQRSPWMGRHRSTAVRAADGRAVFRYGAPSPDFFEGALLRSLSRPAVAALVLHSRSWCFRPYSRWLVASATRRRAANGWS
jgi:hypothetical protein